MDGPVQIPEKQATQGHKKFSRASTGRPAPAAVARFHIRSIGT